MNQKAIERIVRSILKSNFRIVVRNIESYPTFKMKLEHLVCYKLCYKLQE